MLPNNVYNLCLQLVEDHKALWRIEESYLADASTKPEQAAFWEKMREDKKSHIEEILGLLKDELND